MLLLTLTGPSIKEGGGLATALSILLLVLLLLLLLNYSHLPYNDLRHVQTSNFVAYICHMSYTITGEQSHYFHLDYFACLHCSSQTGPKSQLNHGAVKDVNTNDEKVHPFHQGASHFTLDTYVSFARSFCQDTHHVDDDNAGAQQDITGWTIMMVKCTQMCPHHKLSPVMTTITSSRKLRQQWFQPG